MVSKNIESVQEKLTLDNFLEEHHAVVSASTGHNLIESYLSQQGLRRKIKLRVPQFSILNELIEKHNLIVTVPSRIGTYFQYNPSIRIFDVPFSLPEFDVTLHWHKKTGDILAQKWFIGFLNEALSNL